MSCTDEDEFNHIALSKKLFVHPFPETGLLRKTDLGFTFKGKHDYVQTVLDAFTAALQGPGAAARRKREISRRINLTGESMKNWPIV